MRQKLIDLMGEVAAGLLSWEGEHGELAWCEIWALRAEEVLFGGVKIRPTGRQILVKDIASVDTVTEGGLIVLGSKTEQEIQKAVVMAVPSKGIPEKRGREYIYRPAVVAPGEMIIYEKFRGIEVRQGLDVYVLLQESDIVGVVE